MMKVLAAEMSDPQRLRRGKQYANDGSVADIAIEPGMVFCEVQGTRSTPYIATLNVSLGDGMPLRRDVEGHCTCPDADNVWGASAGGSDICKHVVAAMFIFADELLLEPELLDVWRGRTDTSDAPADTALEEHTEPDVPDGPRGRPSEHPALQRRHLRLVGGTDLPDHPPEPNTSGPDPEPVPVGDPLAALLKTPGDTTLPALGTIERLDPAVPPRRELAAVIRDALANLRIEWE